MKKFLMISLFMIFGCIQIAKAEEYDNDYQYLYEELHQAVMSNDTELMGIIAQEIMEAERLTDMHLIQAYQFMYQLGADFDFDDITDVTWADRARVLDRFSHLKVVVLVQWEQDGFTAKIKAVNE